MPASKGTPGVLVVDDDPLVRQMIITILSSQGLPASGGTDGADAIEKATTGDFKLLIVDYNMPRKNGLEVIGELRSRGHAIPIILISGSLTEEAREDCARHPGLQVLEKPFTVAALRHAVSRAIGP
jgi:CheY-like chemotaxis protein